MAEHAHLAAEHDRLTARVEALERAVVLAAIPLEVLHGEIPYLRYWPLGRKIKALSPQLEQAIEDAVVEIRRVVRDG